MTELRSVDPRSLVPNPNNPRRTPAAAAMDEQLVASIKAIGLIQPPLVKDEDGKTVIVAGNRRTKAAIAAGLETIDVVVGDADSTIDAMRAVSENLIRAAMNSVDIWRATQSLEGQGWTETAIADALALPVRTIKRLKLLAHLPPAMLDVMATGNMPTEHDLRTIAAAPREEQTQAWKKHKPKKGQPFYWNDITRALSKRRIPIADAMFDADLAKAYGVVWELDLFTPAGEDGRYTTNVDGFFGAQQEWLQNHLPARDTLLPVGEHGSVQLPRKAEHVYGKPAKGDITGHYLDAYSGKVKSVTYRFPPSKAAAPGKGGSSDNTGAEEEPAKPARPEITQRGQAMIGDLRTDALHEALKTAALDETTLIGLLVLALGANNVSVELPGYFARHDPRRPIAYQLIESGTLTRDPETVAAAARAMLATVLSCRENSSKSGLVARVAGDAIGAGQHLPNMATEDFLSCLSKPGIEKAALATSVRIEARGKDTRARIIERFKSGHYVHPTALFELGVAEIAECRIKADLVAEADDEDRLDPADGGDDVDVANDDSGEGSEPYADAAD